MNTNYFNYQVSNVEKFNHIKRYLKKAVIKLKKI